MVSFDINQTKNRVVWYRRNRTDDVLLLFNAGDNDMITFVCYLREKLVSGKKRDVDPQ